MKQLSLLLILGICCVCLRAAPSTPREQLVRVYRINEEQYDRMLKLTEGKNVISEARLISGGFATVSESLSSGWHSLLRIVGLTTISKSDEEAKLDIDGQPLCVIKTREGEDQFRGESSARSAGKAYEDAIDEEPIHCIVVLKNGEDGEQELPSLEYNSNFNNYWSVPQTQEVQLPQSTAGHDVNEPPKVEVVQEEENKKREEEQTVDEKETEKEEEAEEQNQEEEQEEVTTEAQARPKLTKKKHKYNQSRTNTNSQSSIDSSSRQYVPSYPYPQYPPPAPYPPSAPYPPTSPYPPSSPYPPTPPFASYNSYGPPPPPPPPPFGQSSFGGQPPFGLYNPQSYGSYGPQSVYGQPATYPYGSYGYYDPSQGSQSTNENEDLDDDYSNEAEIEYEVDDFNNWRYDNE